MVLKSHILVEDEPKSEVKYVCRAFKWAATKHGNNTLTQVCFLLFYLIRPQSCGPDVHVFLAISWIWQDEASTGASLTDSPHFPGESRSSLISQQLKTHVQKQRAFLKVSKHGHSWEQ